MAGDARVRCCPTCARDVHDLSAMTELEAATLVLFSGGRGVCVRFEADASGEMRHARPIALPRVAAGLATLALGVAASACMPAPPPPVPPPELTLAQRVAAALDQVPDPPPEAAATPSAAPSATEQPPAHIVVAESMGIPVAPQVHFIWNARAIPRAAGEILDHVAEVMTRYPELTLVSVEGHASPDEPRPVELGEARAQAVIQALKARKVDPARLVAHSYGASRPIHTNDTQDGRATNRRVQFAVLDKSCPVPNAASAP
jgi:outer membrane protein OmpA-like peptidoglycan-associated protein